MKFVVLFALALSVAAVDIYTFDFTISYKNKPVPFTYSIVKYTQYGQTGLLGTSKLVSGEQHVEVQDIPKQDDFKNYKSVNIVITYGPEKSTVFLGFDSTAFPVGKNTNVAFTQDVDGLGTYHVVGDAKITHSN